MALFTCISFSAKVTSLSTAKVSVHFLKVIFNYFAFSGPNLMYMDYVNIRNSTYRNISPDVNLKSC